MTRPRVLLVEDDASIRRFVGMALENHALDFVEATGLASAIDALRGPPFALVLCDLMLPDGHGLDLLRALAEADSPSPGARRVAFSAGVTAAMRVQLEQAGVHEILSKPASLIALEDCVARALAAPTAAAPASTAARPALFDGPSPQAPVQRAVTTAPDLFGGDVALYQTFLAQCRPQFGRDVATGDLAAALRDLQGLRRLAHNVKSALLTLGFDADSLMAARLEAAAAEQRAEVAWGLWPALRARLLARSAAPPPATVGNGMPPGPA